MHKNPEIVEEYGIIELLEMAVNRSRWWMVERKLIQSGLITNPIQKYGQQMQLGQ